MDILSGLAADIKNQVQHLFDYEISQEHLIINPTNKEFEGDYTFVVFPLVKQLKKSPQDIADGLGKALVAESQLVTGYNVVKGFLNLSIDSKYFLSVLKGILGDENYGQHPDNGQTFMIEYSSPNTNKPLHLGHIRNILLGWSVAKIASANGYKVIKTKVVNDRGIAICKSMLAWKKFADGETPESSGIKGDHLVGKYYVEFEKAFQSEYKSWQASDDGAQAYKENGKEGELEENFYKRYKNTYFNQFSALGKEAREMLIAWEDNQQETRSLWETMNGWVYDGFATTYKALGVEFDDIVYESDTYLLGKDTISDGLETGVFYKKEDNSVWVDLEDVGMDHKIVLRSDGTSVYITQDLGTAAVRYDKYKFDRQVYVVADEQEYHFQVLFNILKKLGAEYADNLYHLSYGMVDLTTGKMKSREGTVVDADVLMEQVIETARDSAEERGGLEGLQESEKADIYRKIGLAALKYFLIKINPRKRMVFDPKESVDMQGTTGPYIQNAYVRIQSILRKANGEKGAYSDDTALENAEKDILVMLLSYPDVIKEAFAKYDPSTVANYMYSVAKSFHKYYHDYRILSAETDETVSLRIDICKAVARVLEKGMDLLGIEMPSYM